MNDMLENLQDWHPIDDPRGDEVRRIIVSDGNGGAIYEDQWRRLTDSFIKEHLNRLRDQLIDNAGLSAGPIMRSVKP